MKLACPPRVPEQAEAGVASVLQIMNTTCLERATVRQAWLAAQGLPRDLIIGVTAPGAAFSAHGWLEGDPAFEHEGFDELLRRPARD